VSRLQKGWTLDKDPWSALGELDSALDWKRTYLEADYGSALDDVPAVYAICASPRTVPVEGVLLEKLYIPVYVGQTLNLRTRFNQHVRGYRGVVEAKSLFRRLDFWYSGVAADSLGHVEQTLIDVFGPPVNSRNAAVRLGESIPAGRKRKKGS
jgi:hypothetical protein